MGPIELLNQLLNFAAPALVVAMLTASAGTMFAPGTNSLRRYVAQSCLHFGLNLAVLGVGLWAFGHDGKMLTYACMVLLSATCQWLLLRGWRQ